MIDSAYINLWGQRVGAIAWSATTGVGTFEYDSRFIDSGWEVSPIVLPRKGARGRVFDFPDLARSETFRGLPGLVADILPDKYGRAIINSWLAQQGRSVESLTPVEILCFIGQRAMGAVEIEPAALPTQRQTTKIELDTLVNIVKDILAGRERFATHMDGDERKALLDVLKIGTSAGGARAKAVIAYNEKTKEVRSGQTIAPKGFEHWLIKFDGVHDAQFGESVGYGRIEMAYYLMATAAGVEMMDCRLLEENGRAHFMTKRFDRIDGDQKLHMQTFCALRHFDFNNVNTYSYEQLFETMRMLGLPYPAADQMYRRMVFNVLSKNCDDHTKNFSFLMDKQGRWSLAPAYDICYAYRPGSIWVSRHALSINGKREQLHLGDFLTVAEEMNIKKPRQIIEEVQDAVAQWQSFASQVEIPLEKQQAIASTFVTI